MKVYRVDVVEYPESQIASRFAGSAPPVYPCSWPSYIIGIPSARIVKAIAFFLRDISDVRPANRGLSWFSRNVPRRVESLQSDLIVLTSLTRLPILPDVEEKAATRGYHKG